MFKKVLLAIVLLVAGFLIYAGTRPASYHVERSAKVEAPAAVVFDQIDNLKAWSSWSPWDRMDPGMQKTYEGPERGVGARSSWSGNKKVGKGKMEITESQAPTLVALRLEFVAPMAAVAQTRFQLAAEGEKATSVTWGMDGKNNFVGKIFSVVMNMDKMLGGQFDQGLANLTELSIAEAKKREQSAAEAKAKADAETRAKAEAAASVKPAVTKPKAKGAKGRRRRG
jgi:hypothetical protein